MHIFGPPAALPLFAHLDPERVEAAAVGGLTGPRPTYHFRLPGCRIDDPDWRIAREWNRWVSIERLAADEDRLREACESHRDRCGSPWRRLKESWRSSRGVDGSPGRRRTLPLPSSPTASSPS